jgi:hypothetical protein
MAIHPGDLVFLAFVCTAMMLLIVGMIRHQKWALIGGGMLALLICSCILFFLYVSWPLGPVDRLRVLSQVRLNDGCELKLTQARNPWYWGEPYEVSLWFRRPNEPWQWFYIDHESFHLWTGRIDFDPTAGQANVYCGSTHVGQFDAKTARFRFLGNKWTEGIPSPPDWQCVEGALPPGAR